MFGSSTFININTTDPGRLLAFYRDVVGLELEEGMGEAALKLSPGVTLGFDGHGDLSGGTKEPARVLIDVFVDDVKAERERIEKNGGTFIRKEGIEFWGGVISTLVDPDGNYFQLMKYDPAQDTTANAQS